MPSKFAIVDIFAGPGGLAEGFSQVRGKNGARPFSIALSVEKDHAAHSTLLLRTFLRQFEGRLPRSYYEFLNGKTIEPNWAQLFPKEWNTASSEVLKFELGGSRSQTKLNTLLDKIRESNSGNVILIGGPPCQAYSIAGRSRNQSKVGYKPIEDKRHFLYREYIRILSRLRPAAFVMENVKGILSSSVDGVSKIFDAVLEDLRGGNENRERYRLVAITPRTSCFGGGACKLHACDFVVRAEDFGIPQMRHRVIVMGLRADIASTLPNHLFLNVRSPGAIASSVLNGIPKLRSGLSGMEDNEENWRAAALRALGKVSRGSRGLNSKQRRLFSKRVLAVKRALKKMKKLPGRTFKKGRVGVDRRCPEELRKWILEPALRTLPNHESRAHMESDLARYFYAAIFGEVVGRTPRSSDFPKRLAPAHDNWGTGVFSDRFRVQLRGKPSTTITSHIAKDGHYFIHPDPLQGRSLTVREAARLQTFPDNYFFKGTRTDQYTQVGNAVPPLLARKIGQALYRLLESGRVTHTSSTRLARAEPPARLNRVA